jgi:Uma2 family endonuclease
MSTTAALLTVAEYEQIPNPPSGIYELHHGELVLVSSPVFQHGHIQRQIEILLRQSCEPTYYVDKELACRPLPEYEVWRVDVGMVLRERVRAIRKGWLMGAPELVVEVLSPSNTLAEMADRQQTMFAGGCRQFWIVDADEHTITTSAPDGQSRTYTSGDMLPLDLFGAQPIPVDEVFLEP